jgi:hypothetical protein
MANQLKMAVVHSILTLKQLGWSQRRIAEELGTDREMVACYVRSPPADSKPATNPIPGFEVAGPSGTSKSPGPESRCEPFRAVVEEKLTQGLTGQRIYQDLVEGHGFAASYSSLRPFLQHLDQSRPIPFRRMEVLPGTEAQVDFGAGAPILRPEGTIFVTISHAYVFLSSHAFRNGWKPSRLSQIGMASRFQSGSHSFCRLLAYVQVGVQCSYSLCPLYLLVVVWNGCICIWASALHQPSVPSAAT